MARPLKRGPVSVRGMRNGEEVLQYHRGRLKLIRKEFGKIFELEFSSPEMRELKTFAKYSDVKRPQHNAMKVIKDGVRIAAGGLTATTANTFYGFPPEAGDANTVGGEFEVAPDGENVIIK